MRKIIIFVLIIGALGFFFKDKLIDSFVAPRKFEISQGAISDSQSVEDISIVARDLDTPWDLAFLPDGSILTTERPGKVTKVAPDGNKSTIFSVAVNEVGEGGLLGIALHPDFEDNHFAYLYFTIDEGNGLTNKILRYRLENDTFSEERVILDGIQGASNHDGGRIKFGPDGYLYITTGDAQDEQLSQNPDSLNGKILRVTDDGSIPSDNPFGTAVYSYGHRNSQGLAWDSQGELWATEHGPSGTQTGNDELNKIEKGQNYGWPEIRGMQTRDGMVGPVYESGLGSTWAPAGLAYLDGSLFFGGLRGSTLYEFKDGELIEHFKGEYGRIRGVEVGPDGFLYITTSNRDGRGFPKDDDDKIIKINPQILK